MRVSYLDAADSEFDEAIAYYNTQRAGLGFEFADEVKEAVERIKNYPDAWTPLSERVRRCQGPSFSLPHHLPSPRRFLDHRRRSAPSKKA